MRVNEVARDFVARLIIVVAALCAATCAENSSYIYLILALLVVLCWIIGDLSFLIIIPAWLLVLAVWLPVTNSYVVGNLCGVPFQVLSWLSAPAIVAGSTAVALNKASLLLRILLAPLLVFGVVVVTAAGGWLADDALSYTGVRLGLPVAAVALALTNRLYDSYPPRSVLSLRALSLSIFVCAISALTSVLVTPNSPINGVAFDEAHGRWATIISDDGPEIFGRSSNYTYSRLAHYAFNLTGKVTAIEREEANLPEHNQLVVLKMPSQPIGPEFQQRLINWVENGGRLLIVADHTDLYDHAQYINNLLAGFGAMRLRAGSVYDREGRPNRPISPAWLAAAGRIDATNRPTPWLTGTHASYLPLGTIPLAVYGPSYAEPGDYGRPNRFGFFLPRTRLPFENHVAAFAFPRGSGVIAVIMDGTPWSNFAIFREEFRRTFRGIVGASQEIIAIRGLAIISFILLLLILTAAIYRARGVLIVLSIALGLAVGLGLRISSAGVGPLLDQRDFGMQVTLGPDARLEFLPQLVGPGERNYSRIIGAMAKYDLNPIAAEPGSQPNPLSSARRWLIIEPSPSQLPPSNSVLAHLRRGGDLTVIFPPDAAALPRIREWLASIDLNIGLSTALSTTEDSWRVALGAFGERRGATIMRDSRSVTAARPDGLMKEHDFSRLWQTYTVRPSQHPRVSGLLTVGFGADQIADTAVGDVWEGVRPSALGLLRERQLGALLRGDTAPSAWPEVLTNGPLPSHNPAGLRHVLVSEDGAVIFDAQVPDLPPAPRSQNLSFADNPGAHLASLRSQALGLIENQCPVSPGSATTCGTRLLAHDLSEWLVVRHDVDGVLQGIELLHERRWSGMGANINIVFGN